jgi:endonuclease/exonuclease/phosphatase family metal-dependent hydrolase
MLHCSIQIPKWDKPLHTICVHLGLFARWRHAQLQLVADYIDAHVPADEPLMIAGDFNDWTTRAGSVFAGKLGLHEVFEQHTGRHARSFPSVLPILSLDRVYTRGFHIHHAEVHSGARFIKMSDHAVLSARLTRHHAD